MIDNANNTIQYYYRILYNYVFNILYVINLHTNKYDKLLVIYDKLHDIFCCK